jgi:RHS repeat-associated protein
MTIPVYGGSRFHSDLKLGALCNSPSLHSRAPVSISSQALQFLNTDGFGGFMRNRLISAFAVLLLFSTSAVLANAQYTTAAGTPTFTTAIPVEMGFTNVANGNLHIEIPLASFPQRGSLIYNARLVYDSLIWKIDGTAWKPTNVPNSMGGWRLITGGEPGTVSSMTMSNPCDTPPPIQYRTVYGSFKWTAPDGTSHTFPIHTMRDTTVCNEGISSDSAMADDASGYLMVVTNTTSATVYAPDGTQVYPTVMDTNGNYFSQDANGNIIDTLQRTPITVTTNGNTTTYAILNAQGTRTNVVVTTTTVSANTAFGEYGVAECQTNCSVNAIQSVEFDDGTSYSFTYDSGTSSGHFAELTSMKLRTGATASYGYTTFVDGLGNSTRWLSSKTVGSDTWSFTPQSQGQTAQQVMVTEPAGIGGSIIYGFSLNNGAWMSEATYVDTTGALVYLTNTWDTSNGCPYSGCSGSAYVRKLTTKTQFPGGLAKTVTYSYNSAQTGQISEIDESDYSNATPPILRKTFVSYAPLTHTVSKPSQVTVKDGSDNMLSQVNYTYDEPQYLTTTTGVVQHGTSSSARGNPTTVSRWVSGSTYLTSHTNFFDTGVPYQTIDPNTSPTQYSYMCQGAFPTSVAAPLGLTSTLDWDCNTGLLNSTTDPNNQVTSYHYDGEGRATEIDYPGGGQKKYTFNVSSDPPNVVTTTKIDSAKNLVTTVLLDGLGRNYQSQLNSDPAGTVYVDTVYDQLGRVLSVSNPYRSTADPTYGITTYSYDALGRTTKITRPDNATVEYNYSSRATSVQDEGNGSSRVQKIYQNDGLGRLTSVCEVTSATLVGTDATPAACGQDIPATGFLTTYQYDALTTRVKQGRLPDRVMTYDGLARLVSETIPEAFGSATTYNYDNSTGDLYQRIRPTANQTDPAVMTTTTYSHDSLHRLTQIQYSDGTLGANYYYDEPSVSGLNLQNSKGRLTHTFRGTGNICAADILSYDPVGRIQDDWQQTPYNCGSSSDQLSYQYDAAGNVTSFTNGRGVTFTPNYDSSSAFVSMTSSLDEAQHPGTLISGLQYNALGMATAATLGNGVNESFSYNKRGWIESAAASASSSEVTTPATPGTGSINVGGTEQSTSVQTQPATQATGSVTISGAVRRTIPSDCPLPCRTYIYDYGTVAITVNGVRVSASYSQGSTSLTIAGALANAINGNPSYPVTASSANGIVYLTSKQSGASVNYSLSASSSYDTSDFNQPSFTTTTSGATLAGGADPVNTTVYDSGTVSVTVAGAFPQSPFTLSAAYGNGSSEASVAAALASALNSSGTPVNATATGTTINITSTATGAATNYSITSSAQTNDSQHFSSPSFSTSPASTSLAGGKDAETTIVPNNPVYTFSILDPATGQTGYAGNGSILYANDSTNGNWSYTYDDVNRLKTSMQSGQGFSYVYDRYGNRWEQNVTAGEGPTPQYTFDVNNHITGSGISYDAAGNITNDGLGHAYTYDAENRVVAVDGGNTASYVYDAMNRRVQAATASGGTQDFLFDLSGKAVTVISASDGSWLRSEVWSPAGYLATYANGTTYFNHTDWLGTVRARSDMSGGAPESYTSLPFGDLLSSIGISPVHFTGQERDTDSGMDHFLFRQYNATQGRWMSPDPAGMAAVDPMNPQTWNRYVFVANDPCNYVDPLGLAPQCSLSVGIAFSSSATLDFQKGVESTLQQLFGPDISLQFSVGGVGDVNINIGFGVPGASANGEVPSVNGNPLNRGTVDAGLLLSYQYYLGGPQGQTQRLVNATARVAAHELGHELFLGHNNLGGIMARPYLGDVFSPLQFSSTEHINLLNRCLYLKNHPGNRPVGAGGFSAGTGGTWAVVNTVGYFDWSEMGWASGYPMLVFFPAPSPPRPMQRL